MTYISFTVPGEAKPQGRPRTRVIGGHAAIYDDPKSRSYKGLIQLHAIEEMKAQGIEWPLAPSPLGFTVALVVKRRIPKSFSKKKAKLALDGDIRPQVKPDLDNVAKAFLDALTGVIWHDDTEVVDLSISRIYAESDSVLAVILENDTPNASESLGQEITPDGAENELNNAD